MLRKDEQKLVALSATRTAWHVATESHLSSSGCRTALQATYWDESKKDRQPERKRERGMLCGSNVFVLGRAMKHSEDKKCTNGITYMLALATFTYPFAI